MERASCNVFRLNRDADRMRKEWVSEKEGLCWDVPTKEAG